MLDEIHVHRGDAAGRPAEVRGQAHALQKHFRQDYRRAHVQINAAAEIFDQGREQ